MPTARGICAVEWCDRPARTAGWCSAHYQRLQKGQDMDRPLLVRDPGRRCSAEECNRPVKARGVCDSHYARLRRGADLAPPLVDKPDRVCEVPGCDRVHFARGYCNSHWRRVRVGRSMEIRPRRTYGMSWRHRNGYRLVPRPDHPNANHDGWILEHRLVMAAVLGRPLLDTETVHHINGDRGDNRPANLELWASLGHPSGQRVEDQLSHALEVVRRYAPDLLITEH